MKKIIILLSAIAVLFGITLAFAGELPTVKMDGSTAKFPREDKVTDKDIMKFVSGKNLNGIPQKYQFMLYKWWRGQLYDANMKPWELWYIFISEFSDGKMCVVVANEKNKGLGSLICTADGVCSISGAKEGSAISFVKYNLEVKEVKGTKTPTLTGMASGEFFEAGEIPEAIWGKKTIQSVPQKDPEKIKVEDGIVVFPDESPDVNLKSEFKRIFSPNDPKEISVFSKQVYGREKPVNGLRTMYLVPLEYNPKTKVIKLVFSSDNKGASKAPGKFVIEGIYDEINGSSMKIIGDKSGSLWAKLFILPIENGYKIRLQWSGNSSNTDLFPVAEIPGI